MERSGRGRSAERKQPKYDFNFEKSWILFNLHTEESKSAAEDNAIIENYKKRVTMM